MEGAIRSSATVPISGGLYREAQGVILIHHGSEVREGIFLAEIQ